MSYHVSSWPVISDRQELSAGDHKSLLSLAPSYGLGLGHLWVPGAELRGLGLRALGFAAVEMQAVM